MISEGIKLSTQEHKVTFISPVNYSVKQVSNKLTWRGSTWWLRLRICSLVSLSSACNDSNSWAATQVCWKNTKNITLFYTGTKSNKYSMYDENKSLLKKYQEYYFVFCIHIFLVARLLRGKTLPTSVLDMTPNHLILELWGVWSTLSLPLLPVPLKPWLVASERVLFMGQIEQFDI